ncbi:MAG: hypothetical protein VX528_14145, partial [Candidatus Latescibacterota bacterium]|nr:hypothetical protein [Candidatus Latescibacterota bacterium]
WIRLDRIVVEQAQLVVLSEFIDNGAPKRAGSAGEQNPHESCPFGVVVISGRTIHFRPHNVDAVRLCAKPA